MADRFLSSMDTPFHDAAREEQRQITERRRLAEIEAGRQAEEAEAADKAQRKQERHENRTGRLSRLSTATTKALERGGLKKRQIDWSPPPPDTKVD